MTRTETGGGRVRRDAIGARRRVAASLLLAVLVGSVLTGCRMGSGYVVTTDPPDLARVPRQQIDSSMWILAAEVQRLDAKLRGPVDLDDAELRRSVIQILDQMIVAARQIDTPGRSTPHHPLLGRNLETFLQRLDRAKRSAQRTPPDYYPARVVSSGCALCHGPGQATTRRDGPPSRS